MKFPDDFGPTITLKELCSLLDIGRSTYYTYIDPFHKSYKADIPKPLPGYSNNKFCTPTLHNYFNKLSELAAKS